MQKHKTPGLWQDQLGHAKSIQPPCSSPANAAGDVRQLAANATFGILGRQTRMRGSPSSLTSLAARALNIAAGRLLSQSFEPSHSLLTCRRSRAPPVTSGSRPLTPPWGGDCRGPSSGASEITSCRSSGNAPLLNHSLGNGPCNLTRNL